jgi:ligand-binding SRPBCC domain-containing protein
VGAATRGRSLRILSDAHNLKVLTPPWLKFQIVTPGRIQIASGANIKYRIRLHGIPLKWTTEIRTWDPPHRFSDAQLSGPYSMWHHTHTSRSENGGTRMNDVVRYRLPFGILGRLINIVQTRREIATIFAYRRKRIQERFGGDA